MPTGPLNIIYLYAFESAKLHIEGSNIWLNLYVFVCMWAYSRWRNEKFHLWQLLRSSGRASGCFPIKICVKIHTEKCQPSGISRDSVGANGFQAKSARPWGCNNGNLHVLSIKPDPTSAHSATTRSPVWSQIQHTGGTGKYQCPQFAASC